MLAWRACAHTDIKMQPPLLTTFLLTQEEYDRWKHWENETLWRWASYGLIPIALYSAICGFREGGIVLALIYAFGVTASVGIIGAGVCGAAAPTMLAWVHPTVRRYLAYEKALRAYKEWLRQSEEAYWRSLSGRAFEMALAQLFQRNGYEAVLTQPSGDEGIDLLVAKGSRQIIVQCKATRRPVGPAVVRELYGTLAASGADLAVLAATGGVTSGVRQFALGKPIAIMTLRDILSFHAGQDPVAVFDLNERFSATRQASGRRH